MTTVKYKRWHETNLVIFVKYFSFDLLLFSFSFSFPWCQDQLVFAFMILHFLTLDFQSICEFQDVGEWAWTTPYSCWSAVAAMTSSL